MKHQEEAPIWVFVGYDDRQHEAYEIAKYSILSRAKRPIKVVPLYHKDLRKAGLYTREATVAKDGNYIDVIDGRPFSTQFSFSRFLVPELWRRLQRKGRDCHSLCVFVDCDVVFLRPIDELIEEIESRSDDKALYVVKHNYKAPGGLKMDGCKQENYNMKLWSALMVFNMDHASNERLTSDTVNIAMGSDLHSFKWLSSTDEIGAIEEAWQFLPEHSEERVNEIKMLHLTEGGPWFAHMRDCSYSELWYQEYSKWLQEASRLFDTAYSGLDNRTIRTILARTDLDEISRSLSN